MKEYRNHLLSVVMLYVLAMGTAGWRMAHAGACSHGAGAAGTPCTETRGCDDRSPDESRDPAQQGTCDTCMAIDAMVGASFEPTLNLGSPNGQTTMAVAVPASVPAQRLPKALSARPPPQI